MVDWKEIDKWDAEQTPPNSLEGEIQQVAQQQPSQYALRQTLWSIDRAMKIVEEAQLEAAACSPMADSFQAAFEVEPTLAQNCQDPVQASWFSSLLESPGLKNIRNSTCLDVNLSAIAAMEICRSYLLYKAEIEKRPPEDRDFAEAESVTNAIGNTEQTIEQIAMLQGAGNEEGSDKHLPLQLLKDYYNRVRNSTTLKRILDEAGRFWRLCQALQRTKTTNIHKTVLSHIRLSGDPNRLIPWELAQVAGAIPDLQPLALYRLATGRCLSYELINKNQTSQGPIIVTIDESGSMEGQKIILAKAFALAIARLCKSQRRLCVLAAFSSEHQYHDLLLKPNENNTLDIIQFMEHFYKGGTHARGPMVAIRESAWPMILKAGAPPKSVDHILITDEAIDGVYSRRADYRKWAEANNVKTYGISVDTNDSAVDVLKQFCDVVWYVTKQSLDHESTRTLLSL